jgi:PEP-CTERM motif
MFISQDMSKIPGGSRMRFLIHIVVGTLSVCLAVRAGAIDARSFPSEGTVINFEDLAGGNCNLCGTPVTTQYAALGVRFNNPSFPGQDTVDTNLTFGIPNASYGNALYVAQGGHLEDAPALPFQILFSDPVSAVGFDYGSSSDSFLRLDTYDSNNILLESLTYVGGPSPIGAGGFAAVQESSGITRLDVSYHPDSDPSRTFNFSIDNLKFESAAAAVPEPSTVGLIGVGTLVLYLRRRRVRPKRLLTQSSQLKFCAQEPVFDIPSQGLSLPPTNRTF